LKQLRKRLTYANVMSSIAVFLVLGGGAAFAANQLAKNSVGSKQLKKNAVTSAKIKNGAVTASKLGAGAVGGSALGAGSITNDKLANGAVSNGKLANGAVGNDKLANGAVTNDKLADGAVTGSKVAAGTIGRANLAEGALVPRGYALVESNGLVDPAGTVNLPNASNPESGVFCFDLPFAPKSAQATVQGDSEPNDFASIGVNGIGDGLSECPPGTELEILVWNSATGEEELSDEDFFVVVW